MRQRLPRAPFPWFGGKSRVAHLVWERFGQVRNYVEPFAGSLAVLLGRPDAPGIETVNDADAYLANFWRAVAADPDEVARYADWPVSEPDLHARHRWLVEQGRDAAPVALTSAERAGLADLLGGERAGEVTRLVDRHDGAGFVDRVKDDPEYYNAKVAGWWVWGQCLWIGSGWCSRPEWTGRPNVGRAVRGIHRAEFGKLPAIAGRDGGRGAYAKSRGSAGWKKRPSLAQGGQRGALAHQVPDLAGDSGTAGRGIHASGFHARVGGLQAYMRALADRLRRVRVCCGDFERILGPAVTTCIGLTGVLLDPPYPEEGRAICYTEDGAGVWWRAYRWAVENGGDPLLRIALCGYEHPDAIFPERWTKVAWKASGGYGSSPRGKANAARERIWFSPACLQVGQGKLF